MTEMNPPASDFSQDNIEKLARYTEGILDRFEWHKLPRTKSEAALKDMEVIPAPSGFASIVILPFVFIGIRSIAKDGIAEQYFVELDAVIHPLGTRLWNNEALQVEPNA